MRADVPSQTAAPGTSGGTASAAEPTKVSKRKIDTSPDKNDGGDAGKPLFAFNDVYAAVAAQGVTIAEHAIGIAKLDQEMKAGTCPRCR